MLRIYFGVLGIVVTTGGEVKSPKVDIDMCAFIWVVDSMILATDLHSKPTLLHWSHRPSPCNAMHHSELICSPKKFAAYMYALTFRLALVGLNFSLPSLPCSPTMFFTVILIRVLRMKLDHFRILMNSILTSTRPMLSSLNVCQLMALTCCWSSGECQ